MVRSFPVSCARAASGHAAAAAPPSSVMNARRFMSSMGTFSSMRCQRRRPACAPALRSFSLP